MKYIHLIILWVFIWNPLEQNPSQNGLTIPEMLVDFSSHGFKK